MRRHASVMERAITLAKGVAPLTAEQRQDYTLNLVATLNDAQGAWDAYREHLREHGLPPSENPSTQL
jgi:hypothetical protein